MKLKLTNYTTIYMVAVALIALALGFSDVIFSNYYADAYEITATQRGFIEIPREFPGIIAIFVISFLSRFGDIKIASFAQVLSMVGILILAFFKPSFYTMTAVLFIFSLGTHVYLPLQDSLALSVMAKDGNIGSKLGKVKGLSTIFSLIASFTVFVGFKFGFFSFTSDVIVVFVIAGVCFFFATLLLTSLAAKVPGGSTSKPKMVFRKEYKYYYTLAIMHGVQKQIVIVYAPWVIIEMLGQGADTTAFLIMLSSICGVFFLPFLGRCLDRFGLRTMLYADAISFIAVYLAFAFMAYNFYVGNFKTTGIAMFVTFGIFVIDRMSSQMSMIRVVYLNKIAVDKKEVLSTLSLGISLDHIVAITCSFVSGLIWTYFGPHYIFILAASFSLINLAVAKIAPLPAEE